MRRIDPLLIKAAQTYYQCTKASEAGDPLAALEFFDAFTGLQHLVREQMAVEHSWAKPYTIEQKAWADRQIFEVAVLALVRAQLHVDQGTVPAASLVLDSHIDRRAGRSVSLLELQDGTVLMANITNYRPGDAPRAWRDFNNSVVTAKENSHDH